MILVVKLMWFQLICDYRFESRNILKIGFDHPISWDGHRIHTERLLSLMVEWVAQFKSSSYEGYTI